MNGYLWVHGVYSFSPLLVKSLLASFISYMDEKIEVNLFISIAFLSNKTYPH